MSKKITALSTTTYSKPHSLLQLVANRLHAALLLWITFLLSSGIFGMTSSEAATSEASSPGNIVVTEPDADNLRLLRIRVGVRELEGLLDAYAHENLVLIPVGALSQAIDLPLVVEPEKGVIRGSMFRPEETLYLDLSRGQVVLSGKASSVSPDQIKIYPGDIYVDANLLSSWLPFKLDADLFSSVVTIRSPTRLPFEERIERETRYAGLKSRGVIARPEYPSYFEPYAQWSYPFLTATLQAVATQDEATATSGTSYNYSLHGTGDMFRLESSLYLSGTNQKSVDNFRFTLGRKDPDGRLLGPLNAQEYSFGHVNSPTSSLVSRPTGNHLGAMVSNFPLSQQGEFDRHTFRGELPAGWEVELYQNDSLSGYVNQPINGQYVFANQPLYFGTNYFRLVFYGPQGQRREETYTFELSDALAKKGAHRYRAIVTEDPEGGDHSGFQYDFGLGERVTLSTEIQNLTLGSDKLLGQSPQKRSYARAGLRGLAGGMFLSGDSVTDSGGGSLVELGVRTGIGTNTRIDLTGIKLDGFVSDTFPRLSDPLINRTNLYINTVIPPLLNTRIPVSFGLTNENYASGSARNVVSNRLSLGFYRFSISNSLSLVGASNQGDLLTGQLQMSMRANKFNLRSDVGYSIDPSSEVTSVALTIDNIRRGKGIYSLGINQQLTNSITQYSARYNRPVGLFAFDVGLSATSAGSRSLSFGLTVGAGREPRTPEWIFDSRPIAGSGAVSARVFLDKNQNGVFDNGEPPLPGVGFKRNGGGMLEKTNEDGIAFITNLTSYSQTDIGLSVQSLEDPLWSPAIEGVRVHPRPGAVAKVDFPVLETGEIDGTIYLREGTGLRSVSDVVIELINESGKVIKTTKSAPDGFYVFSAVPPGKYLVRISPDQIRNLGLFDVRPIQIEIDENKQFISGINFRLERR